jgi:glycosyltransferase involved in cell wall biosynthesis
MIEIILITYNRVRKLRDTLNALIASDLSELKITVLDNCSDDGTSEYLLDTLHSGSLNFTYIRHPVNIGASANTMRAYEIATENYVWIICDDDVYDFSAFKDVQDLLKCEQPDILVVGSPSRSSIQELFPFMTEKMLCASELSETRLPILLTFLPAAIIKTKKLKSCDFRIGYALSHTLFPQFFWISRMLDENWTVYVMPKFAITRPDTGQDKLSDFIHMNGYLGGVSSIKDMALRCHSSNLYLGNGHISYTISLTKTLLKDRLLGRLTLDNYFEHLKYLKGIRIACFMMATLALLIPNYFVTLLFKKRMT